MGRLAGRIGPLLHPGTSATSADGQPVERRLAAIMVADIVGYSRLMGIDEVGTLRRLTALRRDLIDPTVAARRGRIVKATGDGILAQFPSAVEAVLCATAIQRALSARNETVPETQRLVLRIGINIGDIIVEAGDIFGDGVNIAARLETLSPAGGLCISRAVRDQVRDKLPIAFDDLGEQTVKNIARPVRVFALGPEAIIAAPDLGATGGAARTRLPRLWIAAGVATGIIVAAGAWWAAEGPWSALRPVVGTAFAPPDAGLRRVAIAVLPFAPLGAAASSDYFADGLTEDIISALGRFRELLVMSRVAVLAYKGKAPTPEEVGRHLKVRYVVEGTIRRTPERVRVTVSLTDTERGALLWSEHYDAEPRDIFAVEDGITRRISSTLAVRVTRLELERSANKPPSNLEAYDLVLRGRDLLSRSTRAANAEARGLFERAIERDPNYTPAYVGLGNVDVRAVTQGWTPEPVETLEQAEALARKAIALDDADPSAHALLADAAVHFGDYDRAFDELNRAIERNPNDAKSYGSLIGVLLYRGDTAGAITAGERLIQSQPEIADGIAFDLAMAYVLADRAADAIRTLQPVLDRNPGYLYGNVMLAAAYAAVGRLREAERQAELVRRSFPTFTPETFGSAFRDAKLRAKLLLALKKAGL